MSKRIKRIPVTKESFIKNASTKKVPPVSPTMGQGHIAETAKAKTGKVDPVKAKYASTGVPGMKQASFGVGDVWHTSGQSYNSAYRSSYANSGNSAGAFGDVPLYFALMNENNGGILYWPVNLKEKYSWYRYFYRCFTNPNVPITLEDGTEKPLLSLSKGEKVINVKGKSTEIECVTTQNYSGDVISIKVEGKDAIEVTPEHPFLVIPKSNIKRSHNRMNNSDGTQSRKTNIEIDYKPVWKEAKEILQGDCLIVPKLNNNNKCCDPTIEFARLLGYYIAEGSMLFRKDGTPKAVRFHFGSHEEDLIKEVKSMLSVISNNKVCDYTEKGDSCTTIRLNDVEFAKKIYSLAGSGARRKKLSVEVFNYSDTILKNIIACWMNGDGYKTKENQNLVTTTSYDLASQMYLLMVRIGYCPTKAEYKLYNNSSTLGTINKDAVTNYYKLYISTNDANDLSEYSKWEAVEGVVYRFRKYNYNGNMLLPVRSITKRHHEGIIYNIQTIGKEYDDRTFLVDGIGTHNTDPFVGQAIDLHVELPLSKIMLKMPKMKDKKRRVYIEKKYQEMMGDLKIFEKLQSILFEYLLIGNCYIFLEWDEKKKQWKKMIILPPEEVNVFRYPFSDYSRIEYNPEMLMEIITRIKDKGAYSKIKKKKELEMYLNEEELKAIEYIPIELLNHIIENEAIVMDTDPYTGDKDIVGSYVYHLARRKSEYEDLGVSILERCLVPLLMKEHYKYTQLSLASRNMTPRNKISAPGITPEDLDDLREQIDLSMLDPDYSIVTNYDWSWEQIGADQRLMDLQREYETIENQLFAGLGITRELLTGEGQYSGGRITVEIMNTRYMLMREVLKNMIEENIFKPVAEVNGFYDVDKDGFKTYYYPSLSFNRLSIRDNSEVFDSLFQLYQKGSLPIDTILELFNIDTTEVHEKLVDDQFTVKDAVYNDMMRGVYSSVGDAIVQNSDIVEKMVTSLNGPDGKKLNYKSEGNEDGGGFGGDSDSDSDSGDDWSGDNDNTEENNENNGNEQSLGEDEIDSMAEDTANAIADEMPSNVTSEDIDNALNGLLESDESDSVKDDDGSKTDASNMSDNNKNDKSDDFNKDNSNDLDEIADNIANNISDSLPDNITENDIDSALEQLNGRIENNKEEIENTDIDSFADELATELEKQMPENATKEDVINAINLINKKGE